MVRKLPVIRLRPPLELTDPEWVVHAVDPGLLSLKERGSQAIGMRKPCSLGIWRCPWSVSSPQLALDCSKGESYWHRLAPFYSVSVDFRVNGKKNFSGLLQVENWVLFLVSNAIQARLSTCLGLSFPACKGRALDKECFINSLTILRVSKSNRNNLHTLIPWHVIMTWSISQTKCSEVTG